MVAGLAAAAEAGGYTSFWITVLAGRTEPAAVLGAALGATERIEVGLGLVPLDSFPGAVVGRELAVLPGVGRATVALGVGRREAGAAALWRAEAEAFRAAAPGVRIAVGGYGPRVLAAGGACAEAVLVNWMTPERGRWALERVGEGAAAAGRAAPRRLFHYVPTALGAGAAARLDAALGTMSASPYHRRHQRAMAAPGPLGLAFGVGEDPGPALAAYAPAEPVLIAVGDLGPAALRDLLAAAAPIGPGLV